MGKQDFHPLEAIKRYPKHPQQSYVRKDPVGAEIFILASQSWCQWRSCGESALSPPPGSNEALVLFPSEEVSEED